MEVAQGLSSSLAVLTLWTHPIEEGMGEDRLINANPHSEERHLGHYNLMISMSSIRWVILAISYFPSFHPLRDGMEWDWMGWNGMDGWNG